MVPQQQLSHAYNVPNKYTSSQNKTKGDVVRNH